MKRAKVILQPGTSVGYVNKPSYGYNPPQQQGSSMQPVTNGATFRSNGRPAEVCPVGVCYVII